MLTAAAATSILSLSGASAFAADADAVGTASDSPGILSGNSVQAPADVPVNACGNSVDAVGVANAAAANSCANSGDSTAPRERPDKTEPTARTKATAARGEAKKSPGVLAAGNIVKALNSGANAALAPSPKAIPEQKEQKTQHLSPTARVPKQTHGQDRAMRHTSSSPAVTELSPAGAPGPQQTDGQDRAMRHTSSSPAVTELSPAGAPGPQVRGVLAATGSDEDLLAAAAAGSAALLIGGGILYRRGGVASRR
ncbi:chaplin [Streptomyces sp. NBC_01381]|uniref:chaplin n=1 Tax=Streptomyces sp. NBC_01381 TaxID=2903845 RepID=UPI0022559F35|nr:chaplin [Streptomyces sp. NBC_01381]MCX4669667.1 chaplin [Streptomyces sp. NBC_01381]